MMSEPRSSSEPWSEVPPELEELLRAELARKGPGASDNGVALSAATPADEPQPEVAEAKPAPRKRATRAKAKPAAVDGGDAQAGAAAEEEAKPAPRKRATRTAKPKAEPAPATEDVGAADEPKKPVRKRRTTKAAAADEG